MENYTRPTVHLRTYRSCVHQLIHMASMSQSLGKWNVAFFLVSNKMIGCNKAKSTTFCNACQLGKDIRLLFSSSNSRVENMFDIIHSDFGPHRFWVLLVINIICFSWIIFPILFTYTRYVKRVMCLINPSNFACMSKINLKWK